MKQYSISRGERGHKDCSQAIVSPFSTACGQAPKALGPRIKRSEASRDVGLNCSDELLPPKLPQVIHPVELQDPPLLGREIVGNPGNAGIFHNNFPVF